MQSLDLELCCTVCAVAIHHSAALDLALSLRVKACQLVDACGLTNYVPHMHIRT